MSVAVQPPPSTATGTAVSIDQKGNEPPSATMTTGKSAASDVKSDDTKTADAKKATDKKPAKKKRTRDEQLAAMRQYRIDAAAEAAAEDASSDAKTAADAVGPTATTKKPRGRPPKKTKTAVQAKPAAAAATVADESTTKKKKPKKAAIELTDKQKWSQFGGARRTKKSRG